MNILPILSQKKLPQLKNNLEQQCSPVFKQLTCCFTHNFFPTIILNFIQYCKKYLSHNWGWIWVKVTHINSTSLSVFNYLILNVWDISIKCVFSDSRHHVFSDGRHQALSSLFFFPPPPSGCDTKSFTCPLWILNTYYFCDVIIYSL